jgi:hypothetical protein
MPREHERAPMRLRRALELRLTEFRVLTDAVEKVVGDASVRNNRISAAGFLKSMLRIHRYS